MAEGTDWDARYIEGDTPWDKGAAAPCLDEGLEGIEWPSSGRVLVPGCGFGHDVLALSRHPLDVVGLDISPNALQAARFIHPAKDNVEFVLGDLFDPTWQAQVGKFDLVWEHTCFCAIEPSMRLRYVETLATLLNPGGFLLGVFFTDTQMPEGEGPPYETSVDELHALLLPHFDLLWEKPPELSYAGREGREWLMAMQKRYQDGETPTLGGGRSGCAM